MSLILLGLIQGLTEFFPVSSSGHLVIAKYFLQLKLPGAAFEAFLHFGTIIAVIVLFRKDLKELVISFFDSIYKLSRGENILNIFKNNSSSKLAWFLVISTMPAAIIGYTFSSYFEILFAKPIITAFMLIITGALLWVGNKKYSKGNKNISKITYKDAIIIGIDQVERQQPGQKLRHQIELHATCRIFEETLGTRNLDMNIDTNSNQISPSSSILQNVPTVSF